MDNTQKLKQVMADVFGLKASEIGNTTSVDTVERWDSVGQLNLVLALEEQFKIALTEQQMVSIGSYLQVKQVLEQHGVSF